MTTLTKHQALLDACGYVNVPSLVLTDGMLSNGAKLLYMTLKMYCFSKSATWVGQDRMCGILGVQRNAIRKWANELETSKLISVTQRGNQKTNHYTIRPLADAYDEISVDGFCDLTGRSRRRVEQYAKTLLAKSAASSRMHPDASEKMQRGASERMQEDEQGEDQQEKIEQALSTGPAQSRNSRPRKRAHNPLARGEEEGARIGSSLSSLSADIAKQSLAKVKTGGMRSKRGKTDVGFGQGFDIDASPYEIEVAKCSVDKPRRMTRAEMEATAPLETTEFEPWSRYVASGITMARKYGGGVKDPDKWTGPDFESYRVGMIQGWRGDEPPPITSKSRAQAKRLVNDVGGDRAKDLLDFCFQQWDKICAKLNIDADYPNAPIIEGFLESLTKLQKSGFDSKGKAGTQRASESYDDEPSEGW